MNYIELEQLAIEETVKSKIPLDRVLITYKDILNMNWKDFDKKVEITARRLSMSKRELKNWTIEQLVQAWDLLGMT